MALKPPGQKRGTADLEVAKALLTQLTADDQKQTLRGIHHLPPVVALGTFARDHLVAKARAGTVTEKQLRESEHHLKRAVAFFGADRALETIAVRDVRAYVDHVRTLPTGRGAGGMAGGTLRHHLNSLSNLFRRGLSEGYVTLNPVSALLEKPTAVRAEAKWLEVPEAAWYLEAARLDPEVSPGNGQPPVTFGYPLLATYLLTGRARGRSARAGGGGCGLRPQDGHVPPQQLAAVED